MCCPPDVDRDYKIFEFEFPGLIQIQNDGDVFDQNDTLWVKTVIPNMLEDKNGEQFDINELTGNSGTAYLGLNLFLKSNFTQASPVILSEDEIISTTGKAVFESVISVTTEEVDGQLQSEFGVVLKEKGAYFLGAVYPEYPPTFYLETTEFDQISIQTNFANQDSDRFEFSVE